ncbi:MAG: ABC transporter substrate binding protein, partial [Thermoguttaceae bacterium]
VVQIIDNLTAGGFPTITRAAAQEQLPVFSCQSFCVEQGAVLAMARDYYDAGRETAMMAVRIMGGEEPGRIAFSPPRKLQMSVNQKNAQQCRLVLPAALLKETGGTAASGSELPLEPK